MSKLGAVFVGLGLVFTGACGGGGSSSDAAPGGDGGGGDGGGCYVQDTSGFNCGENGGADCVVYPTGAMMAVNDDDTLEAPDFTCVAETPSISAATIAVSGKVRNFQDNVALSGASVSSFSDFNFGGTPLAAATTNATGDYTLTLPVGTPNRTHWLMEHAGALPTIGVHREVDTAAATRTLNLRSVSTLTANALPAFIGHARTPGLGVLVGNVQDCQGRPVTNAIGVVSATTSVGGAAPTFLTPAGGQGGEEIYFFGDTGLPTRRNSRNSTNLDGVFVAIEVPVGSPTAFVQAWGYLSDADACTGPSALKLLSELPSPVLADTVISSTSYPNQGPL